jgi:hypothetical protein
MPITVDDDAKPRIPLTRLSDDEGRNYYIGKFQFPGTLDFRHGVSFMVFVSEPDYEELQIGPIDDFRRSSKTNKLRGTKISDKIHIDLHPAIDSHGKVYYLGEAVCMANVNTTEGVFFTIFVSREGSEEIQISQLDHSRKIRKFERERIPLSI